MPIVCRCFLSVKWLLVILHVYALFQLLCRGVGIYMFVLVLGEKTKRFINVNTDIAILNV
jgi:hypothetical protein